MGSMCVECRSTDTRLVRGDDGHFRKECDDCGHVGGPYTSNYDGDDGGQASLADF
jgi:translation initiation factor 2 beta subunit (eIF-2beta)/eIF-5